MFSKICDHKIKKRLERSKPLTVCVCVCVFPTYILDDERVAGDSLHGFEQEAGQRHALTPGVHR